MLEIYLTLIIDYVAKQSWEIMLMVALDGQFKSDQ